MARAIIHGHREEDMTKNSIRFEKVPYKSLAAKQKELFNFQKIAATLADLGYNCIKLADDCRERISLRIT